MSKRRHKRSRGVDARNTGPRRAVFETLENRLTMSADSLIDDVHAFAANPNAGPDRFAELNGTIFFALDDGVHGTELWKSDGTADGTMLVKDISSGAGSSEPERLLRVGNHVFFTANDGQHGIELWKTDGTTAGTVLVKDIQLGGGSSFSNQYDTADERYINAEWVDLGGRLLFHLYEHGSGRSEIWISDGTASGTFQLSPHGPYLAEYSGFSRPLNGQVYFGLDDGVHGVEPWVTDGTVAGTRLLKDVHPEFISGHPAGSYTEDFTIFEGEVYFLAFDTEAEFAYDLWKTDGTTEGTVKVADFSSYFWTYNKTGPVVLNGRLVFRLANGEGNLWSSDGTPEGTISIGEMGYFDGVKINESTLVFADTNGDLWSTDGTAGGTELILPVSGGNRMWGTNNFSSVGGLALFVRYHEDYGYEYWVSDGTAEGTHLLKDITPGPASRDPGGPREGTFITSGSYLYFPADDGLHGRELWRTDGTTAGTVRVSDFPDSTSAAPIVTGRGITAVYPENSLGVAIDSSVAVTDADSAYLQGAQIAITAGYVPGEDLLSFTAYGVSRSFDASTGILTLTGTATVADYQAMLRNVDYSNLSDDPATHDRTITMAVTDGNVWSAATTWRLVIVATNELFVVEPSRSILQYVENSDEVVLDPALTISGADSPPFVARIRIASGYTQGEDFLSVAAQDGITGWFYAPTGLMTLLGTASVATYQAALRSVAYTNINDDPATHDRAITMEVHTGRVWGPPATWTLAIVASNDAPILETALSTLEYVENSGHVALDAALTVSDANGDHLTAATITIATGYTEGEDVLSFASENGITGVFHPTTGVLSLTGTASVAAYQAALRSVTYSNTSDDPATHDRTISMAVSDGIDSSSPVTWTLEVVATNDAPVVENHAPDVVYVQGGGPVAILADITVLDLDNDALTSATITITGNYAAGEDLLVFEAHAGITGSFDALTGTLTLDGAASLADYEATLASVAYANTGSAPSLAPRTIALEVCDGEDASLVVVTTVNVSAAANDNAGDDTSHHDDAAPSDPSSQEPGPTSGELAAIALGLGDDAIADLASGQGDTTIISSALDSVFQQPADATAGYSFGPDERFLVLSQATPAESRRVPHNAYGAEEVLPPPETEEAAAQEDTSPADEPHLSDEETDWLDVALAALDEAAG